ncbi:hypothetical protein [Gracilimonas sediminicola]|uniref:hypothetical protein n=1 Tax=Gracilimonas sediminicola TaxID=2952158 RepID=UPI0038D51215
MDTNNLFKYADKELVIDAFLCWLIEEMNTAELSELRESFLKEFLELDESIVDRVMCLKAEKQVNNVDVICTLKTHEGDKKIIFENKMHSTEHSKQLKRYKDENPDALEYIYLKLGYVHRLDRKAVKGDDYEYKIRSAKDLERLIEPLNGGNPFIKEFYKYLHENFVVPQSHFPAYLKQNIFKELDNASFQQFVMERIKEQLKEAGWEDENLKFKIGNNPDGRPWTQLDFSQIRQKYGELDETLFFRLDKSSGKNYLRINLYSQQGKKYWDVKKPRLGKLRKVAEEIAKSTNLKPGDYYNRAKNEVETIILFFEDGNPIQTVISHSVKLATALRRAHQKMG